jgi:hypothetical protein
MRGSAEVENAVVAMFRCERISISMHVNGNSNGNKERFVYTMLRSDVNCVYVKGVICVV